MATIFRSWLCDVRLVERLGRLPPGIQAEDNGSDIAVLVEDNENNRAQKYPLQGVQVQVQLIYSLPFVTTDERKIGTRPNF